MRESERERETMSDRETSLDPTTADPAGAPRAFEKQTLRVSTFRLSSLNGVDKNVAACQIRAPSMCKASEWR
jgi:hypothetical protein